MRIQVTLIQRFISKNLNEIPNKARSRLRNPLEMFFSNYPSSHLPLLGEVCSCSYSNETKQIRNQDSATMPLKNALRAMFQSTYIGKKLSLVCAESCAESGRVMSRVRYC